MDSEGLLVPPAVSVDSAPMRRWVHLGGGLPRAMRLGLATRGNTHPKPEDVARAVERGVNYLNWCGYDDGLARAVREGFVDRARIILAMQLENRDAAGAERELNESFRLLGTERIDVVTLYYLERESEWKRVTAPGGALEALTSFQNRGMVSLVGLTTHQRALGAKCAQTGKVDLLMIRYNAAHRGAEEDVFPVTDRLRIPVVAYTAQRWGALAKRTPGDPSGFRPPAAREWYRFALSHPSVSIVLMAPNHRRELEENLSLLDDWRAPSAEEFEALSAHGRRVRRHAGVFW
jgi:predicted aldo/keto reductase-like oxidoreductase